jgi:hypothetical protein
VPEEGVDGQVQALDRPRFQEREHALQDREIGPGRFDVDRIGLGPGPVRDLDDRHRGVPHQDLREQPFLPGILVQDHHKRQAGIGRQMREERFERLETPRRCPDPDDGAGERRRFGCRLSLRTAVPLRFTPGFRRWFLRVRILRHALTPPRS